MIVKNIKIIDYKIFKDCSINFNDNLTIITGGSGSGKTILFNLLKENLIKKSKNCNILIEGELNSKNLDYMFINEKSFEDILNKENIQKELEQIDVEQLSREFEKSLISIFSRIPWNGKGYLMWHKFVKTAKITQSGEIMITNFLDIECKLNIFSAGEKTLISFALLLAVRKLKNIDDTLVFDNLLNRLDNKFEQAIFSIIKELPCQIILLSCYDVQGMNVDYKLKDDRKKTIICKTKK